MLTLRPIGFYFRNILIIHYTKSMGKYKLANNVLGWITFIIASSVYLMTMEPTASFWDCGEFIASAYKLEVGHPPGAPFFMLTANLFSQFASDPSQVAAMVNAMSAIASGLTILFLFWSITHLVRKVIVTDVKEITSANLIIIMGSGLVGALAYTFSDTFWFSAVEGEVYAYSSLFTAIVFWLILKWEDAADKPHADRWIVLIAYLMGLSIGVHLLNLLCIPAIVLVYYYKKFENPTTKGAIYALLVSFIMIAVMMYGIVQGLVEVCGWFELFFVNTLGMPYNSGVYAYVIMLGGVIAWAIYETMRSKVRGNLMKVAFILSVTLIGIPFIGNDYWIGVAIIVVLTAFLFFKKNINIKTINTILVTFLVIVIGYSSYALILIRSSAGTPMDQNSPEDIFTLRTYLAREQYGQTPLVYGQTFTAEIKRTSESGQCVADIKDGAPVWSRVIKKSGDEKDRYYISRYEQDYEYVDELCMFFPRMYSSHESHIPAYKEWSNYKGETVRYDRCGEVATGIRPTFAENMRYFFSYQLNFMYWRYFMWNFSGRQNDIQGHGGVAHGNWITGIKFIDEQLVGPQDDMPAFISENKGHNVYYMLPLLLGLIGLFFQLNTGKKGTQACWITFLLFFMTGIAIVLYLNQPPLQPRERDYAYAGSFYAFCIWIGFGVAGLAKILQRYLKLPEVVAGATAALFALFVPFQMAAQNWDDHDRSGRYAARDFGANYLESCEPNAIIFTNGDNDTFPLWYAQEVEGIRTDVRVCNTSYLQTDWYIDQMKRQAYDSEPLPISWNREDYVQGTRDVAYVLKRMEQPIDLGKGLEFVRSNEDAYKTVPGIVQKIDHFPSETLVMSVDSAAVIKNKVLSPEHEPFLLKDMSIDLSNREVLHKQELIILDMLQTNNWERPMYYAVTVSPTQFVNLDGFFQQTGLAYQIVPLDTKKDSLDINSERMYDNVMNKYKWGGVDKPGVYLDETVMRMCKSYRILVFGPLASTLINEGKTDKALAVLDKAMAVLPMQNIPADYSLLTIGEAYYRLGEIEKADEIYDAIAKEAVRTANWMFRLNPGQRASVMTDLRHNLAIVQEIIRTSEGYESTLGEKYRNEFGNLYDAFISTQD
jgi:Protein of unknown function (DUF2723).